MPTPLVDYLAGPWVLMLNDMRSPKSEIVTPVVRGSSRAELVAFVDREKVLSYTDGKWGKTFRQGGLLEWYNPPLFQERHYIRVGTEEDWVNEAKRKYAEAAASISSLPAVPPVNEKLPLSPTELDGFFGLMDSRGDDEDFPPI